MTIEQRNQIIELCKQHIDEQGSVRVGWAAEKILGEKPQHNMLDKVAAVMLEDGQYVKELANPNFRYDWNIRRNPNFRKEKWIERNPIGFEIIKGLITAVLSIIVSVILTLRIIDNKNDKSNNASNNAGKSQNDVPKQPAKPDSTITPNK